MTFSFFKLPAEFTICSSALLGAGVILLQNADQYAARLETALAEYPVLSFAAQLPDCIREMSELSYGSALNQAEKQLLDQAANENAWFSTSQDPAQEPGVEPLPADEPIAPPETERVIVDTSAVIVLNEPEILVLDEPEPVVAEQPAEPEESVVQERVTIPAATSVHWRVLSAPLTERRVLFPDFAGHKSTDVYFVRTQPETQPTEHVEQKAEPEAPAAAEPAPEPNGESAAPEQNEPAVPAEPVVEVEAEPEPPVAPPVQEPSPAPQQTPPEGPGTPPPSVSALAAVPVPVAQNAVAQTPPMRYRIMMVGDSLMEDLGPLTHRMMSNRKGLEFIISAKFSTGLCRSDFFNWAHHMQQTVNKYPPDMVIFFMGANDGQPIKEGRYSVPTGGKAWRDAYARKMDELVQIAYNVGSDVIWVELPAVGGRYNKLLHENQIAQREYCTSHGVVSLQTDPIFSGEWGRFEAYGMYNGRRVRLRTKDLEHLTKEGNMKLLDHLLPLMESHMRVFYDAHPERRLSAQEAARIPSVPVVYTCKYTPPKKPAPAPGAPAAAVPAAPAGE